MRGSQAPRHAARSAGLGLAAALAVTATGCGVAVGDDSVDLDYWLWDANQLLPYQQCVDAFEEANPDVRVRISQYGFDDYWMKLTAGFVAGTAPDVFTDHLSRYPEYVQRDLLLDLDSLDATAAVDADEFQEGLADLWVGQDGGWYGMPKDFDTVAVFYNETMLSEAGLTPEDLQDLDWNPQDGGSFEEVVARLTVDSQGHRGDEEEFDPDDVVTYGLASQGSGGTSGQTMWSWTAGSTGWRFTDTDVWGQEYNFDDPRLHESLDWLFGFVDKGYLASYEEVGGDANAQQQLGSGQAAMTTDGSWMINSYTRLDGVDVGIAGLPAGPTGHPVSMYNGLADSISADTDHPQEAARLVAFLGSETCQNIVGDAAVVLPARPASTDRAVEAFAERGIDVSPFTDLVEEQHTMFYPVTDQFGAIDALMTPAMDEIYIGGRDAETLADLNERVNAMLE
ncbi:sugar ABC transporter substrate-binding protein [Nesterenkonia sp. HG001]|uniref:ABC transporter substrate-binding protein n=1 Tax=Nesterenkonia sp. HG001 TaxID=2983207 RepID=UPI002AC53451|nr:sugar ABC transporter substrate-binding protein [Nesterenkonia sp. HG001]MDZ5078655.1 sugar ABC transporter substrate-binding protein [Nesterenkonia sp. HG001]